MSIIVEISAFLVSSASYSLIQFQGEDIMRKFTSLDFFRERDMGKQGDFQGI